MRLVLPHSKFNSIGNFPKMDAGIRTSTSLVSSETYTSQGQRGDRISVRIFTYFNAFPIYRWRNVSVKREFPDVPSVDLFFLSTASQL